MGRSTIPISTARASTNAPLSRCACSARPTTQKSPCRRECSPNQCRVGVRRGISTRSITSSARRAVVNTPRKKSSAPTRRSPLAALARTICASSANKQPGSSADGCARQALPPIVPRLRIAACATWRMASTRSGQTCLSSAERSMSTWRVSAPMRMKSVCTSMPRNAVTPLISSTAAAPANRMFSIGNRLWPPASSRQSSPCSWVNAKASAIERAR